MTITIFSVLVISFTAQKNPHFVIAIVVATASIVSAATKSSFSTERVYPHVEC